MNKFQKPFVSNQGVLNPKPGDPDGFVSKDGMWKPLFHGQERPKGSVLYIMESKCTLCRHINRHLIILKNNLKLRKTTSTLEEFL